MNEFKIPCNGEPSNILLKVSVNSPMKVRVMAFNPNIPNTYYTNRVKTVNGQGEFEVRMPQNCENVIVRVIPLNGASNQLKIVSVEKQKLNQFSNCFSDKLVALSFTRKPSSVNFP